MRGLAKASILVAALCAFFACVGSALAAVPYEEIGTFANNGPGPGGSGSASGQLSNPGELGVNDLTGEVYVGDQANNRVQVFKPTPAGAAFEYDSGEVPGANGLAIDQATGEVYVSMDIEPPYGGLAKFDSDLNAVSSNTGWANINGAVGSLAVDPVSGDILIAERDAGLVRRFGPNGAKEGLLGSFAAERPLDIAVDSQGRIYVVTSTGDIFSDCAATSTVRRFSPAGVEEGVVGASLQAPGQVAIDPDDDSVFVASAVNGYNCGSSIPQVTIFDSVGTEIETLSLPGNAMFATVSGLAVKGGSGPSRFYVATKSPFGDSFGATGITAFLQPKPDLPTVVNQSVVAGSSEATLRATINPQFGQTGYRFEYGLDGSYGQATPTKQIPAGHGDVSVEANLAGLQAGRTYHFRVVATNSLGTTTGQDKTFATSIDLPGSCPNEAIRQLQRATFLPDCRAYEQVSPVDKNGANVLQAESGNTGGESGPPDSSAVGVSASGNQVTYAVTGALKDAQSAPNYNLVDSLRTGDWTTRSLSSAQVAWPRSFLGTVQAISPDQTTTLDYSELALVPGAIEGDGNYYLRDAATGRYTLIAAVKNPKLAIDEQQATVAVGDKSRYAVFGQKHALTPDAVEVTTFGDSSNLYEYLDGQLHLLSSPGWEARLETMRETRIGSVSADGRRVYFVQTDGSVEGLYLSEDGGEGKPISVSQRPGDPATPQPAILMGVSKDGGVAYFSSDAPLTVGAPTSGAGSILYRYTVADGKLTAVVSPDPEGSLGAGGFPGPASPVSNDGGYVYFTASGVLAPGAQVRHTNIYGWHAGDLRFVGAVPAHAPLNLQWSVSADGRTLAFDTPAQLTPYDNTGAGKACPYLDGNYQPGRIWGYCAEVYVYDWSTDELTCASCPEVGVGGTGHAALGGLRPLTYGSAQINHARSVASDGTVFFDTPQRLVGADVNGKRDVYAYRDGRRWLLSTGKSPTDTFFNGTNMAGTDVFISTADRLVGQDQDRQVDLYDVRVDGGIPSQQIEPGAASCTGTACQAPAQAPPRGTAPSSSGFHGAGNAKPRRHKAKKHKARKRCAVRRSSHAGKRQGGKKQAKSKQAKRRAAACKGGNR